MLIAGLLLLPLAGALLSFALKSDRAGKILLIAGALAHVALVFVVRYFLPCDAGDLHLGGSLMLSLCDEFGNGLLILQVTSILFLLCSTYTVFWLPVDSERSGGHAGMKQYALAGCLLLFLFTMTLTAVAQDFGMLWVAVEATTLASAPLINFHRGKGSLEAMWKYLLICSIGIGLALFGTMLLASSVNDPHCGLGFAELGDALAKNGNMLWFKAGFVLCFAGYALKMGLAPFHTWLPDAHSEAPAPVSALLSGSLLNCALLAILRLLEITPGDLGDFANGYLKFFGFFSLAAAAFFILRQKDFKRMLAYSSVEHMGLIALLIAYGEGVTAMTHMVSHSLCKMMLFLTAGNILLTYGSRSVSKVKGLFSRIPFNGTLWIMGMLFICGTPPSPLFFTELRLVKSAGAVPGAVILLLLLVVFCGMSQTVLGMAAPGELKTLEADKKVDKLAYIPALAAGLIIIAGVLTGMDWVLSGVNLK